MPVHVFVPAAPMMGALKALFTNASARAEGHMERRWVTSPSYATALAVLIEAREAAGLSQRELSDRPGKPRSFVSKIESRGRRVDLVELVAWSRGLGLDPSELMARVAIRLPVELDF